MNKARRSRNTWSKRMPAIAVLLVSAMLCVLAVVAVLTVPGLVAGEEEGDHLVAHLLVGHPRARVVAGGRQRVTRLRRVAAT